MKWKATLQQGCLGIIIIVACGLLEGCTNERIKPSFNPTAACDTTPVSYKNDIQPLIQTRCINQGCHCTGCENTTAWPASAVWDNFDQLRARALNGKLMQNIDGTKSPRMPLNRPQLFLDPCQVDLFRRWIAAGAPNN